MQLDVVRSVLSTTELELVRTRLSAANWVDGLASAGPQAARVKRNLQLAVGGVEATELGELVKKAVLSHERFAPLALPRRMSPPLFSRYDTGMEYGAHTDDAFRARDNVRTDLAATLFLSEPDAYEGGELVVQNHPVKLPAGDLVLYPATTVHRVAPVTRGTRVAAVFWVQSLIRSHEQREIVQSLQSVLAALGEHPEAVALAAVQQNLLRLWAEP